MKNNIICTLTVLLICISTAAVNAADINTYVDESLENLARNSFVTVTATRSQDSALGVIDGDSKTGSTYKGETGAWVNDKGEQSITIDLQNKYPISEIRLYMGWPNNRTAFPSDFKLDFSATGAEYNALVDDIADNIPDGGLYVYNKREISARYIRLTVTKPEDSAVRIREIEIYGKNMPCPETVAMAPLFKASNGEMLTKVSAGDTVKVSTMVSNSISERTVYLVAAAKDEYGVLKGIAVEAYDLSADEQNREISTDFTIPKEDNQNNDYTLEAYTFDAALYPIGKKSVFSDSNYNPGTVFLAVNAPQGPINASENRYNYDAFSVYVKGPDSEDNRYTQYVFRYARRDYVELDYTSEHDSNLNLYRICRAYGKERIDDSAVNQPQFIDMYDGAPLLNTGALELAILEKGQRDFIGTFHGDENLTSVSLRVDGKEISLDQAGVYSGGVIEFEHISVLNRCDTPANKVADYIRSYRITNENGVELDHKLTWCVNDFEPDRAYMAMLPAMRVNSDNTIRFGDYIDFADSANTVVQSYDTSEYGSGIAGPSLAKINLSGIPMPINAYSRNADKTIVYKITYKPIEGIKEPKAQLVIRGGSANDNKIYFNSNQGMTVSEGEIWHMNTTYNIYLSQKKD